MGPRRSPFNPPNECCSYFAYDHKYDEFAIKIAEGGIVPRRGKVKMSKANEIAPANNLASDQEATPGPSESPNVGEDRVATEGVGVRSI